MSSNLGRPQRIARALAKLTICIVLAAFSIFAPPISADESRQPPPLAPGYQKLPFEAPKPGSYQLPPLGVAADGAVVDSDGKSTRLYDLYGDKIVVLGFIYATCDDVNGCPLATAVFHQIQARLKHSADLAGRIRLLTLSFNPEHDTPQVMARYGKGFQQAGLDWRFLTTASEAEIQPILKAYGQTVQREFDRDGHFTGKFSHLLRVILIDRNKRIRNIYTTSFLHAETLIADIETLQQETAAERPSPADGSERRGKPADLLQRAQQPQLGLPAIPTPENNPLTREKIALGRKLFYDRRLSFNNTLSCAMCHIPEQGFTSQEQSTAVGIEGRGVRRNSPTLYNVAYLQRLFHDGRESSLENQVWGPLLSANEMGNPAIGFVLDKINDLPEYQGLFERAFHREASMETLGQAIASYERTLVSGGSPFDRWRYGKDEHALGEKARQGYRLFVGKGGCSACHTIADNYALFTDNRLHNTGVGYRASMEKAPEQRRVSVAPGIAFDLDAAALDQVSASKPNDLGRYEISQNPQDRWKYRTATLRNIAATAPYMHDGSLATLEEVVAFYNRGGEPNENLDPAIRPLHLDATEQDALVSFLESLSGGDNDLLILDAFAAPVGDVQ